MIRFCTAILLILMLCTFAQAQCRTTYSGHKVCSTPVYRAPAYSKPVVKHYSYTQPVKTVTRYKQAHDSGNVGRFGSQFANAVEFRRQLLFRAEQAGVASRFERRFLDGLQREDEFELLLRLSRI